MDWLILKALYFFLPAYFANMAPVIFRKIPWLGVPVHEKLFGQHKTWRGLIIAPIIGVVIFSLQKYAHQAGFQALSLIDYSDFSLGLGFCLGAGAILGDLLKSYYKRKEGIPPGEPWIPWDQMDFVVGGLIGSLFYYVPSISVVMILLIASPSLHIVVNHIVYWLKIRKEKW